MTRKISQQQHQIADLYSELAAHIIRERGYFRGPDLTASQAKSVARDLKNLENRWRSRAIDSEKDDC